MTTGYIPTIPLLTFTGADGEPAVGYKLYTFTAGTTMPTTTWQDINLTVENTNPIILDAQGQCIMWVGTSSCKLQLTTPIGSVVWTIDNVAGAFPSSGTVSLPEALTNTAGHTGPLIDYDGDVFWLDGTMSFRNRLINGDFAVNQRCVSGTVYLSPGQYGHDRWKAGPSGCTYTFSLVNGKTTITILVGTLTQIIEASNVPPGVNNVVLSWTGTAMGQIGSTPFSSIIALATAPGGINLPISFSNGTLTNDQRLASSPSMEGVTLTVNPHKDDDHV